jgi:isocitrate lyase
MHELPYVAALAVVHYEDELASEKKCGHLGGEAHVPTGHSSARSRRRASRRRTSRRMFAVCRRC